MSDLAFRRPKRKLTAAYYLATKFCVIRIMDRVTLYTRTSNDKRTALRPHERNPECGEQISKEVEKRIRSLTSGQEGLQLDMYEAEDQLHIISQPIDGLVKDSIEISLESNILTIAARSEPEATPTSARYLLQERRFGPITRDVELSIPVKGQEARAKVDGGNRLLITLPIDDSVYGNITVTPVE